jgi:transcriptional regulator with GAF, ATPase, and Fis domain
MRLRLGPPITVEDLGSTNGTKINGQSHKGGGPIEVIPGESFHVGAYTFMVMTRAGSHPSTQRSQRELLSVPDPSVRAASPIVADVAKSGINVLILGESGAGKEVLAETVHALSGRRGPLQRINCAALSEQLLESELFGHEKGAFTGATQSRPGLLEAAAGGTAFLDEIGELAPAIQAKLLRAIEAREVTRLGSTRPLAVDVRFVCATNRELGQEVVEKRFRHDLYFRIDGITLRIPPLRERKGMIPGLATQFAQTAGSQGGLSTDVLAALDAYAWPGNVRELKAVMERAVLLARGRPITVAHLAFTAGSQAAASTAKPTTAIPPATAAAPAADALDDLDEDQRAERARIVAALEACTHNQTRAAAKLGISRTNLVTKMRIYRIPRPRS